MSDPKAVALRFRPAPEPDKPPDAVEVLLRREVNVIINGQKLKMKEPVFRFYTDTIRHLVGTGNAGLIPRLMSAVKAVAAQGKETEIEAAVLNAIVAETGGFVCEFAARLLIESNPPGELVAATGVEEGHLAELAEWLADNVPGVGMAALLSSALYVCDVATLRGFFGQLAGQFKKKAKG